MVCIFCSNNSSQWHWTQAFLNEWPRQLVSFFAFSHCPLISLAIDFGAVFLRLNTLDSFKTGDSQVVIARLHDVKQMILLPASMANWLLRQDQRGPPAAVNEIVIDCVFCAPFFTGNVRRHRCGFCSASWSHSPVPRTCFCECEAKLRLEVAGSVKQSESSGWFLQSYNPHKMLNETGS